MADIELDERDPALSEQLEGLLAQSQDAWARGDSAEAVRLAEECYAGLPEPRARWGYLSQVVPYDTAKFSVEAGDPATARTWLQRAREAYGDTEPAAKSMLGLLEGIVLFQEGDLDRAFLFFKATHDFEGDRPFKKYDPKYLDFYRERAGLPASGRSRKASGKTELTEEDGERLAELAEAGNELADEDDFAGALVPWREALAMFPEPIEQWDDGLWFLGSIGDACVAVGEYAEAESTLRKALAYEEGRGSGFIWLRLGQAQFEQGDLDGAADSLISAYMLDGDEIFEDEDPKYRQLLVDRGLIDRE